MLIAQCQWCIDRFPFRLAFTTLFDPPSGCIYPGWKLKSNYGTKDVCLPLPNQNRKRYWLFAFTSLHWNNWNNCKRKKKKPRWWRRQRRQTVGEHSLDLERRVGSKSVSLLICLTNLDSRWFKTGIIHTTPVSNQTCLLINIIERLNLPYQSADITAFLLWSSRC